MTNELMNVLRISEEWMDSKAFTVEAESSLAGDDARTHPYELSQGVAQSIAIAVDHLHCFRMALTGTGDGVLRLHTYAPFTLLRGAIENASIAVWVMSATSQDERIERLLRHEWTSITKLKKLLALAGEAVAPSTSDKGNQLLAVADSCGIEQSKVKKEVTATEIVRAASESTGFRAPEMDLLLTFWKICSAVAHGDRGYLPIFEIEVLGQDRPGVASVKVTAPTHWVLSGSRGAVAMITAARRLAEQRGMSSRL